MKKGKYVIIIFLVFFILLAAVFVSFLYYEFAKVPTVKPGSCLEINLSGRLIEKSYPDFLSAFFMQQPPLSMYDIWTNMRKAKVDTKIDSILLRLGYVDADWAKINEIRDLVLDFRKSGKKVYAYIEEAYDLDKEYYLATACDKIVLHPEGMLVINGIGGYVPFVKKLLDKIGVEAEVERVEEYKTAYNMFTKDHLTPAHREMMESIYSEIFSLYVETASKARGMTAQDFEKLINHAFFQGEQAKEAGLVDEVFYEERKARKDDSIKAIVFRVDSPGGSAVASDSIWREVSLAKKEKPFVVSMSDMAGSGGYQVSMAAHKIIAHPQTLTGSIGVIFAKFNMGKLYEKLGISGEKISFGDKSDILTTFRKSTDAERAFLKEMILDTYDNFITKAANDRSMTKEEIDKIGKGRVWTGSQAQKLGLIDDIGDLSKAVQTAKEMAGIPPDEEVALVVLPKKVSLFDALFGKLAARAQSKIPVFDKKVQDVLSTIQMLRDEVIWELMPFWLSPE